MSECSIDSKKILAKNEKKKMKGHTVVDGEGIPTIERYVHGKNQKLLADIVAEKSNKTCKLFKKEMVDIKKKTPIQVARDLMRENPKYTNMTNAQMDEIIKNDPENPYNKKTAFGKTYIKNAHTTKSKTKKKPLYKCSKNYRHKHTRKKHDKIKRKLTDDELVILKKKLPEEDVDGNSLDSCPEIQKTIDKYIVSLFIIIY